MTPQGTVLATKGIKRKVTEKETNGDTNKKKKQKQTGKTYTEEEVNDLRKQWLDEKEKIIRDRDAEIEKE